MLLIQLTRPDGSEVFVNTLYITSFAKPPRGEHESRAGTRILFGNKSVQDVKEPPVTVAERVVEAERRSGGAHVTLRPEVTVFGQTPVVAASNPLTMPTFPRAAAPLASVGGNPDWPAPASVGGHPDWPGKQSGGDDDGS